MEEEIISTRRLREKIEALVNGLLTSAANLELAAERGADEDDQRRK